MTLVNILRQATKNMQKPMIGVLVDEFGRHPFLVLISCLLSLRVRDSATLPVCRQLFLKISSPQDLLKISIKQLEISLYSLGFYKKKASLLHAVSTDLLGRFRGIVPQTEEELLTIPGVGRKTANLVLGKGFGIPAICVDTHVHRISNRLGLVKTNTPYETEKALMTIVPQEYWIEFNQLLVMWGQNICVPISPLCSQCPERKRCAKIGVKSHR